jgi:alkylation response protein AidB-like acyl-CoA dehydrogenase
VASGVPGCDVLGTPVGIDVDGRRYLTGAFIPLDHPGVAILDDWDAMGMRASGSNGVQITDVEVPSDNIGGPQRWRDEVAPARRGRIGSPIDLEAGAPDPPFEAHRQPGLLIALAVISSVYFGIADGVMDRAFDDVARGRHPDDPITHRLAGEIAYEAKRSSWALDGMLAAFTDEQIGSDEHFVTTMLGKRQIIVGSITVVETAMQMLGAMSYSRRRPYEQALRDVRAGITHPLAPDATLMAVGRSLLGE